jgi:hypothetical protein
MGRTTSIPDIIVRYDGGRGGWSVGSSFRTPDGEGFMFREVVFIEDEEMDEDRFCVENDTAQTPPDSDTKNHG